MAWWPDRARSKSPGLVGMLLGEGRRRATRNSVSDDHYARRALPGPLRSTARPLDRPPPEPALLPYRTGRSRGPGGGTSSSRKHGAGNRECPSRHEGGAQAHTAFFAEAKSEMAARRGRGDVESCQGGLEGLE